MGYRHPMLLRHLRLHAYVTAVRLKGMPAQTSRITKHSTSPIANLAPVSWAQFTV
jgi:hypothetical protein